MQNYEFSIDHIALIRTIIYGIMCIVYMGKLKHSVKYKLMDYCIAIFFFIAIFTSAASLFFPTVTEYLRIVQTIIIFSAMILGLIYNSYYDKLSAIMYATKPEEKDIVRKT